MPQMAEKTSPDAPPNCAVVPYIFFQKPLANNFKDWYTFYDAHGLRGLRPFSLIRADYHA